MTALNDIATGIASQIATTIPNITPFGFRPDSIEPPCILVVPTSVNPHFTMGSSEVQLLAIMLVARADSESAQQTLNDYMDPSSATSVFASIAGDITIGNLVGNATVMSGRLGPTVGVGTSGVLYQTIEFEITVYP